MNLNLTVIDFVIIVPSLEAEKKKKMSRYSFGISETAEKECTIDKGFLYKTSLISNTANMFTEVL